MGISVPKNLWPGMLSPIVQPYNTDGSTRDVQSPLEIITVAGELPENSLLLPRDFHPFLEEANPILTRALKDRLRSA